MKKTKMHRRLSFLLSFVLVLVLMPMTAFAQTEIKSATVMGVTAPIIVGTPTTTGISLGDNVEIDSDTFWIVYDEALGYYTDGVTEETPFESGKTYALQIIAKPKLGYKFADDIEVSFNGNKLSNTESEINSFFAIFSEEAGEREGQMLIMLYFDKLDNSAVYTVSFNANGGTGAMALAEGISGSYTLPSCTFTPPADKRFKGWAYTPDGDVIKETEINITKDTTLYAIWENISPVIKYDITVTDGKATEGGAEITKAEEGTTVTLTANAAPAGKVFDKWEVVSGGITVADANSETATFKMPANEVSVKATYKDKPVTAYKLTTQVNGGHGKISAGKTGLAAGSVETVIFTPDEGYEIDTVTVNGTATDVLSNVLNITMDADKTVIVTYKEITHTHSMGGWQYDGTDHWKECKECDYKTEKIRHSFKWVMDKEATATEKGLKHEECKICGYKKAAVEIPATGGSASGGTSSGGSGNRNSAPTSNVPDTGDGSNTLMWIVIFAISALGLTGTAFYGRKKRAK